MLVFTRTSMMSGCSIFDTDYRRGEVPVTNIDSIVGYSGRCCLCPNGESLWLEYHLDLPPFRDPFCFLFLEGLHRLWVPTNGPIPGVPPTYGLLVYVHA